MGVGGNFWDLLKPYTRNEGFDFLRDKRVAIDLSYWIVQHETAIKGHARNPHLRVTFFRTINLFSKFGAFPVFVLDGDPSPLKSRARIERFFRMSGIDLLEFPKAEEGVSIKRNQAFMKCVRECVELLELLGMPVLRARCEAEALCAQLNSEGLVDACITADSDAFLFGAKCVIKCLRPNSKEPFEYYHISDIEAGLGLKRKQLVAISLLVGNDHVLHGVPGIGIDTALRFVQLFNEDEILDRLHEVGKRDIPLLPGGTNSVLDCHITSSDENLAKTRVPHCSQCGHPGSKRAHLQLACEYCNVNGSENCLQKPVGFKCECSYCDKERRSKEYKKTENWQLRVCRKISEEQNFPNRDIIEMYLTDNHRSFSENDGPLSWDNPKIEDLVDFLAYRQRWEPSYIRQRLLPMLSTIFLREMATNPKEGLLLCDQYEFHTIQRVKIRYGHSFYLVNWKRAAPNASNFVYTSPSEQSDFQQGEFVGASEPIDLLDEPDVPKILVEDGCWFLLTDENMELVEAAFPKKVDLFLQEKELRESKSRRRKFTSRSDEAQDGRIDKSAYQKPSGTQLSITEFYRSSKALVQAKQGEELPAKNSENCADEHPKEIMESTVSTVYFSKSARKRLLFR